jgi:para-aminobenzoate synthetase component 1
LSPIKGLPNFIGGAVGYLSYDLGILCEKIDSLAIDDIGIPDCFFAFYDVVIIIDHRIGKLHIVSSGLPEKDKVLARKRAQFRIGQTIKHLSHLESTRYKERYNNFAQSDLLSCSNTNELGVVSNFTKSDYLKAVKKALQYIRQGDIYQVNLSQRFLMDNHRRQGSNSSQQSLRIYRTLREISPTAFGAFLDCRDYRILSASPERFLYLNGRHVQTRPMKGTRARGIDRVQDRRLKAELLNSPKDKAELIMIVDLERNDLGKVCEYGSVRLKEARSLEVYSTVFQTTSTIEGLLHRDKDRIDLIKAAFPGGSITGCPKIRSMQIIEELEPTKRTVYTGSLGYFSFAGDMDFNILIRTLLEKDGKIYFQVGGGIVADSDPLSEYEETILKARAIFQCLSNSFKQEVFA